MKLTITMDLDNDAFAGCSENHRNRDAIKESIVEAMDNVMIDARRPDRTRLHDVNGNSVGHIVIEGDE